MTLRNYFIMNGKVVGEVYNSQGRFEEGEVIVTAPIEEMTTGYLITNNGYMYMLEQGSSYMYKGAIESFVIDEDGFCKGVLDGEVFKSSRVIGVVEFEGFKLIKTASGSVYKLENACSSIGLGENQEPRLKGSFFNNFIGRLALR